MKMYGLKNCDTCRKAFKWAAQEAVVLEFIDVREGDMSPADIARFITSAGWEKALNRKSTTWRSLGEADKTAIDDARAADLITRYPTLLKRPVFDIDGRIIIGFDAEAQARLSSGGT